MKTNFLAPNYKGFRFPPEIISHAVWLYFRFSLSFRDIEELLAQRGVVVSYETVRQWCLRVKFPPAYTATGEKNAAVQISQAGPTLSLSLWTHSRTFPARQAPLVQKANTVPFYRTNSWSGTR